MTDIHGLKLYPGQDKIVNRIWKGSRELIMIHREFGKSTMAEDVALNDLIFGKDVFIMYFSATLESAEDHTRAIRHWFERETLPNGRVNPLTRLKPTRGGNFKWSDNNFVLTNGNRCMAAGLDKHVLGKKELDVRPSRIIVDDPVRKEVGYDEDSLSTIRKTIIPMGGPMTRICVIGTPRRYSDVIMELKNDHEGLFNLHYYPAVFDDGTIMCPEFWLRRGSCCYDDLFPCGDMEGEELIRQHIKQKKADVRSLAWATEYLLKPVDDSSSLMPMQLLHKSRMKGFTFNYYRREYKSYLYNQIKRGEHRERPPTVIGCDHAYTTSDSSDWSVFTVLQVNQGEPFKIIDRLRKRISFDQQKKRLVQLCNLYKPRLVYSESNAAQVVFADDISLYQQHIPIVKFNTGSNKHRLDVGIPSLKTYFENGAIRVPYGDDESKEYADTLFRELNGMIMGENGVESVTKHDDTVDSLWIAIQAGLNIYDLSTVSFGGFSLPNLNNINNYQVDDDSDVLIINPKNSFRSQFT